MSRDADTGTGARAARRSEGADTRRSGIRGGAGRETVAPVDGATALSIEVTGDAAPAPQARPRLWVAPPLPIRAPRATFAAAIIAVVLIGVVGILLVNTKTMEQSFRLNALREEKAVLDKQQQELQRQLVEASGPGNLTAAARRLGLVPAEDPAVLWLPDGTVVGPLNPAKGRTSPTTRDGLGEKAADGGTTAGGGDSATAGGGDAAKAGGGDPATAGGGDAATAGAGDGNAAGEKTPGAVGAEPGTIVGELTPAQR
ncbi:hypothetical protein [Actinoplanes sp. G11-F43]|uniref:hypothetical protein n=1 Tax=Actinoplanes sp. G11-F43 TaxID=3424130 RepID=UPI003D350328